MRHPMIAFGLVTLSPAALLMLAGTLGGVWAWLALFYMAILTHFFDLSAFPGNASQDDAAVLRAGDRLSVLLAISHIALLGLGVWTLCAADDRGLATQITLFLAFGMFFGQISNSNAHELIHRGRKHLFLIGKWLYISLLFGHHTSAHRLVHHVWVGTDRDPNSARLGEGFYRFALRAWLGSFRAGLSAENSRWRQKHSSIAIWAHPYSHYLGGAALFLILTYLLLDWRGVWIYLLLCLYAQMQLLLSDYVQHYGLRRGVRENGQPEPINARHSWNAPQWFTSLLMLNAPRHSEHHTHPMTQFPALKPIEPQDVPTLPHSLPLMAVLALFPHWWRRVMDPKVAKWAID